MIWDAPIIISQTLEDRDYANYDSGLQNNTHTHTNTALKTHSGTAGSTEILEKSCLREKQHNAQGCNHGDTVEDIKCECLHCLCVGEHEQLLEIQGMCWHAQNTHFNRATHSLALPLTHIIPQPKAHS